MKQNREIIVGLVVGVVLVVVLVWVISAKVASRGITKQTVENIQSSVSKTSTTTQKNSGVNVVNKIPINSSSLSTIAIDPRDSIVSWSTNVLATEYIKKQIQKNIFSLSSKIGSDKKNNYNLLIQIAQDYELLSDGKSAYSFYTLAAKEKPSNGLAFSNIGNLMQKLGAYNTAHNAYAESVRLSSSVEVYWLAYLGFLSAHEQIAPYTAGVFVAARKATNSAPNVLMAEANWEESTGNISAAILDWRLIRSMVSESQQKSIDTKIIYLEKNK